MRAVRLLGYHGEAFQRYALHCEVTMQENPDTRLKLISGSLEERRAAAQMLAARPASEYFDALVTALDQDPDEWVRIDVASALGDLGDKRAVAALARAVHSRDLIERWQIEWNAHLELSEGPERQRRFEYLWETLVAEISDIRVAAAQALAKLGDLRALGDLEIAQGDPHDQALRAAAKSAIEAIKRLGEQ